jgi:hypothetical protein
MLGKTVTYFLRLMKLARILSIFAFFALFALFVSSPPLNERNDFGTSLTG